MSENAKCASCGLGFDPAPAGKMPKAIVAALIQAQKVVKGAEKGNTNSFMKYKYAGADEIISVAREALNSNGLAITRVGWDTVAGVVPTRLRIHYLLAHSDGDVYELDQTIPVVEDKKGNDKAEAAALTFSLSYVLIGLLQIPRVDENDVDARNDDAIPARRATAPAVTAAESTALTEVLAMIEASKARSELKLVQPKAAALPAFAKAKAMDSYNARFQALAPVAAGPTNGAA